MTMGQVYTVEYEWGPAARSWSALVVGVPGCHSQGRSLREAMANIREALELWLDLDPFAHLVDAGIRVVDRPRVPGISSDVASIAAERDAVERRVAGLADRTSRAARELVERGVPMRDAAVMLGISHQRVGQLTGGRGRSASRGAAIGSPGRGG